MIGPSKCDEVLTVSGEGHVEVLGLEIMPDRESVGGPGSAGSGFLPLQFPSAFAAFHASTPPGTPTTAMHHATHYHHHAQ